MDVAAYLEHLEADLPRMLAAVDKAGLDASVPGAPAWTVADLVRHVAAVFEHKILAIETGERPPEFKQDDPDLVGWLTDAHARLLVALQSKPVDAQVWTWYPPEQTVGFWWRRMAQELMVHRIDAEQAAAVPPLIDEDLALDGIDELLMVFMTGFEEEDEVDGEGEVIEVRTEDGQGTWQLTLHPTEVTSVRGAPATPDAIITSTADELLLWIWGRGELDPAAVSGGRPALEKFLELLAMATE